jgi:RNA polymerase sigma-70 factor (ECF subfamily)
MMTSALLNSDMVAGDSAAVRAVGIPSGLASTDALHAEYGPRIFRFVLLNVRDRDLAESMTQDTFVRAWAARENFRGECSPLTWLTRIALNLVRDHTRTNRFRFWKQAAQTAVDVQDVATHLPDRVSSAEDALIAREQLTMVWKTVDGLSERQRTVFVLRFVEELELADIAEITSLPISTVKTHLYRALATVRAVAKGKETR